MEIKKLEKVCRVIRGSSPRPKGDPRYFGGNIPWIKISDVTRSTGKYLFSTKEHLTEEGKKKSRYLEPETLIITNSATVGVPKILKVGGCIHDGFLAFLDLSPEIKRDYLYYFLLFVKEHLEEIAPYGTQKNLNTTIMKNLEIPIPSEPIQDEIIGQMNELDRLFALHEESLNTTNLMFSSFLNKFFMKTK